MDWFVNKEWVVSALIPWPTVSYAPDTKNLFRFGMIESGTSFQFTQDDVRFESEFNQWQLGFSYERHLWDKVWGAFTIGYSGFGSFSVKNGGDMELDIDVSESPFVRLSFNYRP